MHIFKSKLPFYPPGEVKCKLQNGCQYNATKNPKHKVPASSSSKTQTQMNFLFSQQMGFSQKIIYLPKPQVLLSDFNKPH